MRSGGNFTLSRLPGFVCGTSPQDKRTIQSGKEDADINVLVKRFLKGIPIGGVVNPPTFADFADVFDFQSAMHVIMAGQKSFMSLPYETRREFDNDPAQFLAFVEARDADGKLVNLARLRELGLSPKEVVAEEVKPMKVEVVNAEPKSGGA